MWETGFNNALRPFHHLTWKIQLSLFWCLLSSKLIGRLFIQKTIIRLNIGTWRKKTSMKSSSCLKLDLCHIINDLNNRINISTEFNSLAENVTLKFKLHCPKWWFIKVFRNKCSSIHSTIIHWVIHPHQALFKQWEPHLLSSHKMLSILFSRRKVTRITKFFKFPHLDVLWKTQN